MLGFTCHAQDCDWRLEDSLTLPEVSSFVKAKVYSAWLSAKVLKGVTQRQIGEALGKNQSRVSKMLNGNDKDPWNKRDLEILAALFEIPLSAFLPELTAKQYAELGQGDREEDLKYDCVKSVMQAYSRLHILVIPEQVKEISDRVYNSIKTLERPIADEQMDLAVEKAIALQALNQK